MTEGERTDERPSATLTALVRERFDVLIDGSSGAWRGEESIGWRGTATDGDRFVQVFPMSRSLDGLAWCDRVAEAAASHASASVHAIPAEDGSRAVGTPDGPVMV